MTFFLLSEMSRQILNWLLSNLLQIFMVPKGWILMTLVNHQHNFNKSKTLIHYLILTTLWTFPKGRKQFLTLTMHINQEAGESELWIQVAQFFSSTLHFIQQAIPADMRHHTSESEIAWKAWWTKHGIVELWKKCFQKASAKLCKLANVSALTW